MAQFTRPAVAVEGSTALPGSFINIIRRAPKAHNRSMRLFGADRACDLVGWKFNQPFPLPIRGN